MKAFDKVIGYESIKEELLQICDMIHNREAYELLGAKLPSGILLYGSPGVGKSLMAKCFVEESGLDFYVIRKHKSSNSFMQVVEEGFRKARENAPSIVFLDDMDKFANSDSDHCDADEFVAVQAGIDSVKGRDVFVIATVNNILKLPGSLRRSGRFDRKIEVKKPAAREAEKIIAHYLSTKRVSDDVNMENLAKMMSSCSCAELEMVLNDAAVLAGAARKGAVEMSDMVKAVLKTQYDAGSDFSNTSAESLRRTALHEAGHLVVSEALDKGSVGLAALCTKGGDYVDGFIHRCRETERRSHVIQISLAGKAAVELYCADTFACGCSSDLDRAFTMLRDGIAENAILGLGMLYASTQQSQELSESLNCRTEAVIQAELERYLLMTRDILLKNRAFLEKATEELVEKKVLLYSDIQRIRNSVTVTPA